MIKKILKKFNLTLVIIKFCDNWRIRTFWNFSNFLRFYTCTEIFDKIVHINRNLEVTSSSFNSLFNSHMLENWRDKVDLRVINWILSQSDTIITRCRSTESAMEVAALYGNKIMMGFSVFALMLLCDNPHPSSSHRRHCLKTVFWLKQFL